MHCLHFSVVLHTMLQSNFNSYKTLHGNFANFVKMKRIILSQKLEAANQIKDSFAI